MRSTLDQVVVNTKVGSKVEDNETITLEEDYDVVTEQSKEKEELLTDEYDTP